MLVVASGSCHGELRHFNKERRPLSAFGKGEEGWVGK